MHITEYSKNEVLKEIYHIEVPNHLNSGKTIKIVVTEYSSNTDVPFKSEAYYLNKNRTKVKVEDKLLLEKINSTIKKYKKVLKNGGLGIKKSLEGKEKRPRSSSHSNIGSHKPHLPHLLWQRLNKIS
jgi:hypothetical protein